MIAQAGLGGVAGGLSGLMQILAVIATSLLMVIVISCGVVSSVRAWNWWRENR